ncbi:MAG TPA: hypothetical protein VM262_05665, partial [Acidimicrobiales bacterium]|nr:hypothetical protein [Acidimicrobiales bacterium]
MTAVDDRPVVVDEKAGWSTPCRAGNFDTCVSLGYRCRNPRHKSEGETPAQRRERLIAEARARRTGDTTPAPASPPPPAAQPPERRRRKPVVVGGRVEPH